MQAVPEHKATEKPSVIKEFREKMLKQKDKDGKKAQEAPDVGLTTEAAAREEKTVRITSSTLLSTGANTYTRRRTRSVSRILNETFLVLAHNRNLGDASPFVSPTSSRKRRSTHRLKSTSIPRRSRRLLSLSPPRRTRCVSRTSMRHFSH
jgi:hypothetical protein